jgi:hypothetical protein
VGAWLAKLDTDQDGSGITPDAPFLPNGDAVWGTGSTRPASRRGRLQRLLLPHPPTMHPLAHHLGEDWLVNLLLLGGAGLSLLVAYGRAWLAAACARLTRNRHRGAS